MGGITKEGIRKETPMDTRFPLGGLLVVWFLGLTVAQVRQDKVLFESLALVVENQVGEEIHSLNVTVSYGDVSRPSREIVVGQGESHSFSFVPNCNQGSLNVEFSMKIGRPAENQQVATFNMSVSMVGVEFIQPGSSPLLLGPDISKTYPNLNGTLILYSKGEQQQHTSTGEQQQQHIRTGEEQQNRRTGELSHENANLLLRPQLDLGAQLNVSICNQMNVTYSLKPLGLVYGWTRRGQLAGMEIQPGQCDSFFILPRCSGAVMGCALTFVESGSGEEVSFEGVVAPTNGILSLSGRQVQCQTFGFYSLSSLLACRFSLE